MRRCDLQLIVNTTLLAAPTIVATVLGLYFIVTKTPKIAQNEKRRIYAASLDMSYRLKEGTLAPDFVWSYGKGVVRGDAARWAGRFPSNLTWSRWKSRTVKKDNHKWGWRDFDDGRLVWVREGNEITAKLTDIKEINYTYIITIGGSLALLLLLLMTGFAIYYFQTYVKSREDFLAATAHDLTTPLVGMRYMIGRDDDEARGLNERMLRIVDNIKDFLRMNGRRTYTMAAFDIAAAYREAYSLFAADYRDQYGRDIALAIEGEEPVMAYADATAVIQILWNLIGNDMKYAAPHSQISARIYRRGGRVNVELCDNGPGMSRKERRLAFNRYWRAKTVLKSGRGGFGIGLCVAREMAQDMGGGISLAPNKPTGCVFTLSLKKAKEDKNG